MEDREIYVEFQTFGSIVKVSAFDSASLTEVSIQGPASAGEIVLRNNALRRLEYMLKKKGIIAESS